MYEILSKNGRKVIGTAPSLDEARAAIAGTDYGIRYTAPAVSEYDNPELAAQCDAARDAYSSSLSWYRVIVTLPDRSQRNRNIQARNCRHAEDIAREQYPNATGMDSWESVSRSNAQ